MLELPCQTFAIPLAHKQTFLGKPQNTRWADPLLNPHFCHNLAPRAPVCAQGASPRGIYGYTWPSQALSLGSGVPEASSYNPERPIGSVRKAHDAAVRRAKIVPGFRLYDLRHTYASRAVMAGVELPTLAALLGHTSVQMTMRYVHPAEEHKREAAAKIEKFKIVSAMELAARSQGVTPKVTTVERVQ